jgi:hypothetical protein
VIIDPLKTVRTKDGREVHNLRGADEGVDLTSYPPVTAETQQMERPSLMGDVAGVLGSKEPRWVCWWSDGHVWAAFELEGDGLDLVNV